MKFCNFEDSRSFRQVLLLASLAALPIIMVGIHGAETLKALLSSTPPRVETSATPVSLQPQALPPGRERRTLQFGVYDPGDHFAGERDFRIRHEYISWANFDAKKLRERLKRWTDAGFHPLLTIEPWPLDGQRDALLQSIADGKYDATIDNVGECLRGLTGPIYLCWGHEMDQDLTKRYPWSGGDPSQYIAAYRHVADRVRDQVAAEIRWVFNGVMKQGTLRYWPGDDYVDYIAMPIYSYPDWDRRYYGYIRDFRTVFAEKRAVVASLNKPIIITELGVAGSADFASFWLHQAFKELDGCADLDAVVYFYANDVDGAWGSQIATPDWRVHPDVLRGLVAWKLRGR